VRKADGIRDFFHVGMISYGGRVTSAFAGALAGKDVVPVSLLANNPLRVEVRTRTRWTMAPAGWSMSSSSSRLVRGPTDRANAHVRGAQGEGPTADVPHRASGLLPALVINITDGQPTDGDPREPAKELCALASTDGNVQLFNAHLSDKRAAPVEFPEEEASLPDDYARLLFRISSELPPKLVEAARANRLAVGPHSRGFVFNADLVAVIRFLDIGTRVSQNVR
jgi:hypothetical protein